MPGPRLLPGTPALVVALAALSAPPAAGQCLLANPSFELLGTGGLVFGGWNQFGSVQLGTGATHGNTSARVLGPDTGPWGLSAFWQRQDTVPGDRWSAKVDGWHTAANPLTGQSQAILNIEWRDAADLLISYETHVIADASTPLDEVQTLTVTSGPAPAGAVATHFLLGTLQGPSDPVPGAHFDNAIFEKTGPPTPAEIQWGDFPGGRTLDFSGRTWRVKGPGLFGPGPNVFCDDTSCVWVDGSGRLHMTLEDQGSGFRSTEIALEEALGYGDYIFTTVGRLDDFDDNTVLGMFLWQYTACWSSSTLWWNPNNEADIEFSRFGNPAADVLAYTVQPFDTPGNQSTYPATFSDGEVTSHAFRWLPDRMEYRSWRGASTEEAVSAPIHSWTYTGGWLPRDDQPRVHINLWYIFGPPAAGEEVVFDEFRFVPDASPAVDAPPAVATTPATRLLSVGPNPFGPLTTVTFSTERPGPVGVSVYDVAGKRVAELLRGVRPAGRHTVTWDGRSAGVPVAAGVYFVRLQAGDVLDTRRVVAVR